MPPELLYEIFSYLSRPPPSIQKLYEQPFYDVTHSTKRDLKSISCVSRRWRRAILPILFQHARMILPLDNLQTNWPIELHDFLRFVRKTHLETIIRSFTLVVQDFQPVRKHFDLDKSLSSLKNHWSSLLSIIDPLRLTLVAPPPILAYLTALRMDLENLPFFHMPYHILSLEQSSISSPKNWNKGMISDVFTLLDLRQWQSLLLNEGSFIRSYIWAFDISDGFRSHYQGVSPPSILSGLTGGQISRLPQTVKSVSYIALYPPGVHVARLDKFFTHVEDLYIQAMPRHAPFPDKLHHKIVPLAILESERMWCYRSLIFAAITFNEFNENSLLALREIRCGDWAATPVWKDVCNNTFRILQGDWCQDPTRDGVILQDTSKTVRSA
jgi:hypothetical protein